MRSLTPRKSLWIQGDAGTFLVSGEVSNEEIPSHGSESNVTLRCMVFTRPTHLRGVIAVCYYHSQISNVSITSQRLE
jgi:hypothetical protein